MTDEQENRLRLLAAAKHRAWEHYENLGRMNTAATDDPLRREMTAVRYSMARAKYMEAAAEFDRAVIDVSS